jgi:superfamily II DNA or RNA helicase
MHQQHSLFENLQGEIGGNPSLKGKREIVLRPYQETGLSSIKNLFLAQRRNRQLYILATGGGKTIVFSHLAKWMIEREKKILILAHREELLEQAEEKLRWIVPDNTLIQTEQGERIASLDAHIVLASVPTLGRSTSNRILKWPRDHFGLVICDEAHHATAQTYRNILEYFVSGPDILSLGVTATPHRHDEESLQEIYDVVAHKKDMLDLMNEGYLVPVVSHRVSSKTDLSKVRTTAGDYNLKDLAATVNNEERNTLIVETYVKRFRDKQGLVFATDLDHVHRLTEEFNKVGVRAHAISGDMDKLERKMAIDAFREKQVDLLVNFGVLTEGFDVEHLDLIISARPTQSSLLLTQIIGRGTRTYPNKTHLDFVEIIDYHSHKTQTAAKIFGFRQEFDCEEHNFLECIKEAERLQGEKEFFNPYACMSWSEMLLCYERSTRVNPAGRLPLSLGEGAVGGAGAEDVFSDAEVEARGYYDSRYRYYVGRNGSLRMLHRDADTESRYLIQIFENGLGGYQSRMVRKPLQAKASHPAELVVEFATPSKQGAVKGIEEFIIQHLSHWDRLLWIKAPWRSKKDPCSDKQWAMLESMGITDLPREQVTKVMASDLISAHKMQKFRNV